MPETESLTAFAATRATLVLHLAITRTRALMAEIEPHYGADCPVVVVYRASQPGERVLRGTVATIADAVEAAGLRQAAVILVGRALDPRPGGESYLYDPAWNRKAKRWNVPVTDPGSTRQRPLGHGPRRRPAGE
jgi:precorrin-4/cobalt-precorrin-4 C11-methyltransferase